MSKKEGILRKLNHYQLLELAESASEHSISRETSRGELIKIIKNNLSLQEIEEKSGNRVAETDVSIMNPGASHIGGISQVSLIIGFGPYGLFGGTIYYLPLTANPYQFYLAPFNLFNSILLIFFATLFGSFIFKLASGHKGRRVGETVSLLGFITGATGTFYNILGLSGIFFNQIDFYAYGPTPLGVVIATVYEISLVSTLVLLGAFFLMLHAQPGSIGLWTATGIAYLIAGAIGLTMLYPLLPFFVIVSGLMGAACLFI